MYGPWYHLARICYPMCYPICYPVCYPVCYPRCYYLPARPYCQILLPASIVAFVAVVAFSTGIESPQTLPFYLACFASFSCSLWTSWTRLSSSDASSPSYSMETNSLQKWILPISILSRFIQTGGSCKRIRAHLTETTKHKFNLAQAARSMWSWQQKREFL